MLREIKDPRVKDAFVSVISVEVTPDLKFAKVYYSSLQGDKKEVARGLRASAGFVRRRIAQSLNLRVTPEFTFIEDKSIAHGAHIATLLNQITFSDEEEESSESEES